MKDLYKVSRVKKRGKKSLPTVSKIGNSLMSPKDWISLSAKDTKLQYKWVEPSNTQVREVVDKILYLLY
jgi:hypothetical protein